MLVSAKEAVLLLHLWSALCIAVPKCKASWFYFSYFVTFNRKCIWKSYFFLKFQVLLEGSSFVASFVEHPACSIVRMYSVLILVFFYFNLLQLIQRASAKDNFSWNFRCSVKEAVLLVRSRGTLYVAFSKCTVSWFYLFYFYFPLSTKNCMPFIIEVSVALQRKQFCCFLHGAPCKVFSKY